MHVLHALSRILAERHSALSVRACVVPVRAYSAPKRCGICRDPTEEWIAPYKGSWRRISDDGFLQESFSLSCAERLRAVFDDPSRPPGVFAARRDPCTAVR